MPDNDKIFEDIAEFLPQIVWTASPNGTVTYYNQRWREFTGYLQSDGLGTGWKAAVHPDDEARTVDAWRHSVETGEHYEIEHRVVTFGGTYKWVLSKGIPVKNEQGEIIKWYGSATDINKLKETEEKLKISTEKNKLLMREVVHRTKNALQSVESLVSLQMNQYGDDIADILRNTQSRIKSIALLHQKLNESNSIDYVNIRSYLEELVLIITRIFNDKSKSVAINSQIDPVDIPVNHAVNLGLITNELVTNSIKHAYPDDRIGLIDIALVNNTETEILILEIKDNGIGIKNSSIETNSLGLKIVYSLVEQNKGTITVKNENGTHYLISFPFNGS
jgi:PAS domain S-box-containing protein